MTGDAGDDFLRTGTMIPIDAVQTSISSHFTNDISCHDMEIISQEFIILSEVDHSFIRAIVLQYHNKNTSQQHIIVA